MTLKDIVRRNYPESAFGGFTRDSVVIDFFSRVNALVKPTDRVLDYGAGRGATIDTDPNAFCRDLKILKGKVAHVEGCDVDAAVLDNPYVDHAVVFDPAKPLPYADGEFDLIVANWVFEHVDDPVQVATELLRVLKPGGTICAMTPNKLGYISIAARLAGNARHVRFLKRIQPSRLDFDVFPTRYRLNTRAAVRRAFAGCEVVVYGSSSEPAYHFNSPILYRLFRAVHAASPNALATTLLIFVRKPAATPAS